MMQTCKVRFKGEMMRKFWKMYAFGWLIYGFVLGLAIQLEDLIQGNFNLTSVFSVMRSLIPAALLLTLVWPLTLAMGRRKVTAVNRALIHFAGAFLVASLQVVLMIIFHKGSSSITYIWLMWPFFYNLMMYFVIVAIFNGVLNNREAREKEVAFAHAQNMLVAAELNALRNKLNPHFLFNTLHSIIALVRKDAKAAESALFRFSDMLRYILDTEKSGSDRVLIDDEWQFVRDYLDLEGLRLGARLQVHWDLDPEADGISLPALSIQPLVENSIKHAFNPRSQPGNLTIRSHVNHAEKCLEVRISDDGPGTDRDSIKNATGMGIQTVEKRLQLAYGDKAKFHISTEPGKGFAVMFSIPTTN